MATKTPTRKGSHGRSRVSTTKKKPAQKRKPTTSKKTSRSTLESVRSFLRERLGRQADDVWGMILVVAAVIIGLSFVGQAGPVGRFLDSGLQFLFGVWSYALPPMFVGIGLAMALGRRSDGAARLVLGAIAVFVGSLAIFHLLTGAVSLAESMDLVRERGGAVGSLLAFPLRRALGTAGAFVILSAIVAGGVLVVTKTSVRELFLALGEMWKALRVFARSLTTPTPKARTTQTVQPRQARHVAPKPDKPKKAKKPQAEKPAPKPKPTSKPKTAAPSAGYQLPPLELLDLGGGEEHNRRALEDTARALEATLHQHGVDAALTKIVPGPTVTRYEVELAPGVKVNEVSEPQPRHRLCAGHARRPSAGPDPWQERHRCRGAQPEAPPREPRRHPGARKRRGNPSLAVGLGMDITAPPSLLNLAELPHVLIAGATGAGKSSASTRWSLRS